MASDEERAVDRPSGSALGRVWRAALATVGSLRFTLMLLILLGIVAAVGTLSPQGYDFEKIQRYFLGTVTRLYLDLGLNDVYTGSWLFNILLALLGFNLVACSALRLPGVVRHLLRPTFPSKGDFFSRGRRADLGTGAGVPDADGRFASAGFRFHGEGKVDEGRVRLYRRHAFAPLGAYVCHLGILVLALGAFIGRQWGSEAIADLKPGQVLAVHPRQYYRVQSDLIRTRFELTFLQTLSRSKLMRPGDLLRGKKLFKRVLDLERELRRWKTPVFRTRVKAAHEEFDPVLRDGEGKRAIANWATELEVLDEKGDVLFAQTVRVNEPLAYKGYRIYQARFGRRPAEADGAGPKARGTARPGAMPSGAMPPNPHATPPRVPGRSGGMMGGKRPMPGMMGMMGGRGRMGSGPMPPPPHAMPRPVREGPVGREDIPDLIPDALPPMAAAGMGKRAGPAAPAPADAVALAPGDEKTLSDGTRVRLVDYYPDFVLTGGEKKYGTRSKTPRNPAAEVIVTPSEGKEGAPQLLFRDHASHRKAGGPEVHFSRVLPDGRVVIASGPRQGGAGPMRGGPGGSMAAAKGGAKPLGPGEGVPMVGLSFSSDPGALWVWVGSVLMILGMVLCLYFRYDAAWCLFGEDGTVACRITSHKPGLGEVVALKRIRVAFGCQEQGSAEA